MIMRYTDRTAQVFIKAYETALAYGQEYLGTEHLLSGILAEGEGGAWQALASQEVSSELFAEALNNVNGKKAKSVELTSPPKVEELIQLLTPRTKRVLEITILEAQRRGENAVQPEHLLAGILREGESVGLRILASLGVDIQQLYVQIFADKRGPQVQGQPSGEEKSASNSGTPTLDQYGRDLTQRAREGKIDPIIGRSEEINRVMQILVRRTKNNPVLIGEPGVGKTAVAEGLAEKIVSGNMPEILKDKRLVSIDLTSMLAGSKYRGEFEERMEKVLHEAMAAENIILFIDELHTIVGAGAGEGSIDAANILKPLLAKGELQIIGATTIDEYRKHIEKDKALARRFQPVMVVEPTPDEALQILRGLKDKYEAHHGVHITEEAMQAAVELSVRYITDRFLPDKAIDLIDEGCSKLRLNNYTEPQEMKDLEVRLNLIEDQKQQAAEKEEFEKAAELRKEELQLKEKMNQLSATWKRTLDAEHNKLTADQVAEIVSKWSGIPVTKLTEEDTEKLRDLEDRLNKRVIGQAEAVSAVARAIRRGRLGLKDPSRPTGSFIFLGTTGVGKTETARALATEMFGDEKALIRFDMSEYMEKFDVSKFIGSPPGYVGYEESGQLTEAVRRRPYSVVLFDEIEKAHPDVFNILLQILDDGRLTDGQGRTVDFRNTIVIMTSNIGARTLLTAQGRRIGFTPISASTDKTFELEDNMYGGRSYSEAKELVMEELRKTFNPEFLNRVDEIVFFHMLSQSSMEDIVSLLLKKLIQRVEDIGIQMQVEPEVITWLAKEGADPQYGARPLRRKIQSAIEDLLSEVMLDGLVHAGDTATVKVKDGKISIEAAVTALQKVEADLSEANLLNVPNRATEPNQMEPKQPDQGGNAAAADVLAGEEE